MLTGKYTCTGQKYPNNYLTLQPFPPVRSPPITIHNIQFKNNSRILFKVIMLMTKKERRRQKSPKKTQKKPLVFFLPETGRETLQPNGRPA